MTRNELLTKLAMELGEWPVNADHAARLLPPMCGMRFPSREVTCPRLRIGEDSPRISERAWLDRRAELINKPSWDSAPEWAEWLAQDSDGHWEWHEDEPVAGRKRWYSDGEEFRQKTGKLLANHDWRQTLERLPATEEKHDCHRCGGSYWTPYHEECPCRSLHCEDTSPPNSDTMRTHSKYHREIKPGVFVDVYDVLAAWGVKNPALQHLIKKALQPGGRGHKTTEQDINDIVASANRAKELEE